MEATPKRKNRQRDSNKHSGPQLHHRRHEIDSYSCSSSESGGISSPSITLPLHLQRRNQIDDCTSPSNAHNDSSSTSSPTARKILRDEEEPSTPTPITTIGEIRSPRSKQLQGKLSRPRRRGHRSCSNLNINNHLSGSMQRVGSLASIGRSDCSIASVDSTSDKSRQSRYTTSSKNSGTTGALGRSRRGSSSNNLHGNNGMQHHSFSSNSLFGLMGGSTYSKSAGIVPLIPSSSHIGKQHKEYAHDSCYNHDPDATMPTSPTSSSSLPPLPSLKVIACELLLICSLYCRYGLQSIRKPFRRFRKRFFQGAMVLVIIALGLGVWLCYDFYADALDVCMPPPSSHSAHLDFSAFLSSVEGLPDVNNSHVLSYNDTYPPRPLVEYYVHGRGIGHYARSVAIVEQLNRAGVDVRMFLTRASMWRAMHEDAKIIVDTDTDQKRNHFEELRNHRGKTTAIPITSITPDQSFFDSLSHFLERISGDCEVSAASGRYPQLVVSDGDFPGMIRAELGGIPSVGIAHGQLFSIAHKPKWVQESTELNDAWNKQGRLNHVSGFFTEWQIATHFCFLESRYHSGTVARAPLRPEVLLMAEARKWARQGKVSPISNGDKGNKTLSYETEMDMPRLPQAERLQEMLITTDATSVSTSASDTTSPNSKHRKLVICYFRDHNGEHVVQALLDADFDVLLFETGYTKDMTNNPYRYGVKWIIDDKNRDQMRKKYIPEEDDTTRDENQMRGRRLLRERPKKDSSDNSTLIVEGHGFEVHRSRIGGPRLVQVMDRSLFVPLMHVADGVASSAGSQLMSECIYSHMPLLAIYKEDDSEQKLNVELSHHIDAPCHRPLVFGNSFESLRFALRSNHTSATANDYKTENYNHDTNTVLDSFNGFVAEVRSSSVSDTYFRNAYLFNSSGMMKKKINNGHIESFSKKDSNSILDEEDPFRGLPDAGAIILEIVKQVIQKG